MNRICNGTTIYMTIRKIIMFKMDQLISKICCSQALLWRSKSLIFLYKLEMISYLEFIPRHVYIETILPIMVILHNQILIQIIKESILLHGLLTKYKMLCMIFLCMIFSIHIDLNVCNHTLIFRNLVC